MKFDCGSAKDTLIDALTWHPVFAWLPITLGPNDCRWLEFVERRATGLFFIGGDGQRCDITQQIAWVMTEARCKETVAIFGLDKGYCKYEYRARQ